MPEEKREQEKMKQDNIQELSRKEKIKQIYDKIVKENGKTLEKLSRH